MKRLRDLLRGVVADVIAEPLRDGLRDVEALARRAMLVASAPATAPEPDHFAMLVVMATTDGRHFSDAKGIYVPRDGDTALVSLDIQVQLENAIVMVITDASRVKVMDLYNGPYVIAPTYWARCSLALGTRVTCALCARLPSPQVTRA